MLSTAGDNKCTPSLQVNYKPVKIIQDIDVFFLNSPITSQIVGDAKNQRHKKTMKI